MFNLHVDEMACVHFGLQAKVSVGCHRMCLNCEGMTY